MIRALGARVGGRPELVRALRREAGVVVVDEVVVARAVAKARADLGVGQGALHGLRERVEERAGDEVATTVDVGPVHTVAVEEPERVVEEAIRGLAPDHRAELLVRRDADRPHRERALHERDVLVGRAILHHERRVELPDHHVERAGRAVVDEDVGGGGLEARGVGGGEACGACRRRGAGAPAATSFVPRGLSSAVAPKSPGDEEAPVTEELAGDLGADAANEQRGLQQRLGDATAGIAVEVELRTTLDVEMEVVVVIAKEEEAVVIAGDRMPVVREGAVVDVVMVRRWASGTAPPERCSQAGSSPARAPARPSRARRSRARRSRARRPRARFSRARSG